MIKAIISLGTTATNKKGNAMFQTKYSNWDYTEFETIDEAKTFGRGCVCGLRIKFKNAAVLMQYDNGEKEMFF